ncbi:MAG: protein translocase subunit SecD [Brumimicrobium sp.]|nr:protein translocase subunit SecD [Brumimicrobium sp.]
MRNRGFFWFFTILLLVVSIYQISFSFVKTGIEKEAQKEAIERVEELMASAKGDSVRLPNGTYVNFETNKEAYDLAKSAFLNEILKKKNNDKVYIGNTFMDVKNKSVSMGLDLEGGMSVTLQLSIPDLVRNSAMNSFDLNFSKPYAAALDEYNTQGGDFVEIFARKHHEMFPDRDLIREFSTSEVISKITNKATDAEVVTYLKGLSEGALDGVETIMSNRINQFGVAQPNITKDNTSNRLYIELPGVKDQQTVRSQLQSTANLEFYLAYKGTELGNIFNELLVENADATKDEEFDDLFDDVKDSTDIATVGDSTEVKDEAQEEPKVKLSSFGRMFRVNIDAENRYQNSPILGFAKASDTSSVNEQLIAKAEDMMLDNIRFVWGAKSEDLKIQDTLFYSLYALKIPDDGKARVGGKDIENARVSIDPNNGERGVSIDMGDVGAEEWGQMTTENVGNFIAIVMDNKVYSAPVINSAITGGQTLISGRFSLDEATSLSNLLNAGALPAPCVIVDEAVVGPTIGAENSRTGLMSFGFALALVLIYLVFYYGKAGIVADIALITNIVVLVGLLAAFGAVLTLAGIAGIVLTMGMSVDANVLIFERAREELRDGKGMKLVIQDGYKNALSSIMDGNITTLLVAIVLKTFGSGPIESFAITLIIGIFTSLFTSIIVTRLIFEWQLTRKVEYAFSSSVTKNFFANNNFRFLHNRKKFYILSGALILTSIIALSTRGLKPSVEFTGGRTYEMVFEKPVGKHSEDIKKLLRNELKEENGQSASIEVKSRNSDYRVEIATDYLQKVPNSESRVRGDIIKALESNPNYGTPIVENSRSVSATVSEELKMSSAIAILFSILIMFVYILIRFKGWQFGAAAAISTAHDVIIVLGIFALLHGVLPFNMEVDQAFVAAILTLIGYTINDTVVVFDRIREFLGKYKSKDTLTIMNDAINSTLGRTINTSSTTFIVLLTIFVFDAGAIKGFIFALMFGVLVGTYSSICVASPIVLDLIKNKNK